MAEEATVEDQEMSEEEIARARGDYLEDETPETEDKAESKSEGETEVAEADADAAADTDGDDSAEQPVEPEAAAEPVQAEADTGDDEDGEAAKPIMLPKSRFDAAMARAREAEAKLAEYESKNKEPEESETKEDAPDFDKQFEEIELKIAEAMEEGDSKTVVALMRDQRNLQNSYFQDQLKQNQVDPNAILSETRAELEFESFRARVEALHPEIDPSEDNEAYDEGVVNQINRLMSGFMAQGTPKQQALDEALSYVYPEGWDKAVKTTDTPPAEKSKPAPKKTNIDKNLEAASQQAPEMVDGEDSTAAGGLTDLNPMTMTEKQLEALTEEQKSFLRGDNL